MGVGYEVEPNLVDAAPAGKLFGPDHAPQVEADAVTLEQAALARMLRAVLREDRVDFADKIISGLALTEVWAPYGFTQNDSGRMLRMIELERGGNWKLAGVLAIGDPGNTADVTVALSDLVPGFGLRVTAKRTDPTELTVNLPLRTLDGSFTPTVAGGAGADKVMLFLRLQRTGARLGRGPL